MEWNENKLMNGGWIYMVFSEEKVAVKPPVAAKRVSDPEFCFLSIASHDDDTVAELFFGFGLYGGWERKRAVIAVKIRFYVFVVVVVVIRLAEKRRVARRFVQERRLRLSNVHVANDGSLI